MNINDWLQRPYPTIESPYVKLWLSIGIGLVCFVFLNVFKPFGLHGVESTGFIGLFGLNAVVSLLIHLFLLPVLLKDWFDHSRWTIGKQLMMIASILLLISLLNYVVNNTVGRDISVQYSFPYFIFMTCAVGVLPVLLMTYVTETMARQRNERSASLLAERLDASSTVAKQSEQVLRIHGENITDEALAVLPDDIIYAVAANNYAEVVVRSDGQVTKHILRLSLKGLSEQLSDYPQFLRCHKSYLVNKSHILQVEGNARSLVLHVTAVETLIPVSRSFDRHLLR